MSYGRQPGERTWIDCEPPLVVLIGEKRERRVWDAVIHTCDLPSVPEKCIACSYRDCPNHDPRHYDVGDLCSCKRVSKFTDNDALPKSAVQTT